MRPSFHRLRRPVLHQNLAITSCSIWPERYARRDGQIQVEQNETFVWRKLSFLIEPARKLNFKAAHQHTP